MEYYCTGSIYPVGNETSRKKLAFQSKSTGAVNSMVTYLKRYLDSREKQKEESKDCFQKEESNEMVPFSPTHFTPVWHYKTPLLAASNSS